MEPFASEATLEILKKVAASPGISVPQLRFRLKRLGDFAFSEGWYEARDAGWVRWEETLRGRDTLRVYLTSTGREQLEDAARLRLVAGKRLRPSVLAGAA